jgi:hypothetical protein
VRTSDLNPTVQLMVGLARRWELFSEKPTRMKPLAQRTLRVDCVCG